MPEIIWGELRVLTQLARTTRAFSLCRSPAQHDNAHLSKPPDDRMSMNNSRYLVTGGCGFIGKWVLSHLLREEAPVVMNVDKLTYAASEDCLFDADVGNRYRLETVDICDAPRVHHLMHEFRPNAVIHLAAESHVDRSIDSPGAFIQTNIVGTAVLLEAGTAYYRGLSNESKQRFRFHHVSTDEVYGSIDKELGAFCEDSPYRPNSPYAASKAASDHMVRAWGKTYGLPIVISNCSNNFGPYQFPEKLIPLVTIRALLGRPLPVYGDGLNIRDWIYVDDHAAGLLTVLRRGRVGHSYNLGANAERTNLDVVKAICSNLDEMQPSSAPHERLIEFIADRPAHDRRYAIDAMKTTSELNWRPTRGFEDGLRETVRWYLDNRTWWEAILETRYGGNRLGLSDSTAAAVGRLHRQ